MQNHVNRQGEQGSIGAYGGTEPAFDAVAVVCLAHNLADGKTDAWACALILAGGEEVSHLPSVLLAAAAVHTLKVSVFAKAEVGVHKAFDSSERTELFFQATGPISLLAAGVFGGDGLDEYDPGLFFGGGVVTDATGHYEELTGTDEDGSAVGSFAADAQTSMEDEKHLVLAFMRVPGKLSLDLRYLDVLIINPAYDTRRPKFGQLRACLLQRDGAGLHGKNGVKLVAETGADGDLVTALGAAAAQNGASGLAGHAAQEAMNLRAAAAIGLKGTLGHGIASPTSNP